jgi:hypothetical protein
MNRMDLCGNRAIANIFRRGTGEGVNGVSEMFDSKSGALRTRHQDKPGARGS